MFSLTLSLITLVICSPATANIAEVKGNTLSDIISKSWQVLDSQTGYIDNDGIDDLVFVIQDTDQAKIRASDWPKSDANPRVLALYKGTKTGYVQQQLVADFIPVKDNPNLLEPFNGEFKGIEITDKGVIKLTFSYFMSSGGWGMSKETYQFQLREGDYQLIGYDDYSLQRNTTETTEYSANFLTNDIIKSHNYDDPPFEESRYKSGEDIYDDKRVSFDLDKRFTLYNINEFTCTVQDILFKNRHYPKAKGGSLADVINSNWKVLSKVTGDLNLDGLEDVVVTMQDTNPKSFDKEYGYNNNPKLIAIYLGVDDGLIKQGIYSESGFDEHRAYISDKGVLEFHYDSHYNSGDNVIKKTEVYKFQLRDRFSNRLINHRPSHNKDNHSGKRLLLIGLDEHKTIRSSERKVETRLKY